MLGSFFVYNANLVFINNRKCKKKKTKHIKLTSNTGFCVLKYLFLSSELPREAFDQGRLGTKALKPFFLRIRSCGTSIWYLVNTRAFGWWRLGAADLLSEYCHFPHAFSFFILFLFPSLRFLPILSKQKNAKRN